MRLGAAVFLGVVGGAFAGCSGGSSGGGSAAAAVTSDTTAPVPSGVATTQSQTPTLPSAAGPLEAARTVTVIAGGFSPSGAASGAEYGVDDVSDVIRRIAVLSGLPTSAENPTASNQVTEVAYYGSVPPAYYSAADVAEVEAAPGGAPRYALIVAKHVRHVLERSQSRHVNLAGASFGGVITRYLIEKDLEGLASEGRIVRWLTLEGTAGGVWIASEAVGNATLMAVAQAFIPDPTDATTMTYDFVRTAFATDRANRSVSPFFADIQVGFQVSTNHDLSQQALRVASNRPNDGVLLVEDQSLTLDARAAGPAVVLTNSNHDTARTHDGLAADVVNFFRSSKRVRVRLVEAEILDGGENVLLGRSEISFSAQITSPAAANEWGITTPIASLERGLGTAPYAAFSDPETLAFDAPLYDWQVAPTETSLAMSVTVEEIDWSFYYDVLENPNVTASDVASLSFDLPVDTLGTYQVTRETPEARVVVEVEVFEDQPAAAAR